MKTMIKLVSGSITPILALGVLTIRLGRRAFNRMVRNEVEYLFAQSGIERETIVSEEMVEGLPEPVRRYLHYTGVVGKPLVRTVYLRQTGKMHMAINQPWIPLSAAQWYTTQPPGFVWDGTMRLGLLPLARARDMYADGKGNMLIKIGSLLPVVDASGEEMDQGAMMRYLSEMIWFPSAFLRDNISFEPVDDASARVTLTNGGRSVTGTMYFDQQGRLTNFVAERYRMVGRAYELCRWSTPTTEYGVLAGLNLPVRGKAVWNLPDGDLEYIDVTISALEYNAPEQRPAEIRSGEPHPRKTETMTTV